MDFDIRSPRDRAAPQVERALSVILERGRAAPFTQALERHRDEGPAVERGEVARQGVLVHPSIEGMEALGRMGDARMVSADWRDGARIWIGEGATRDVALG